MLYSPGMAEKILITGVSGFIASNLASALSRDGHDVIGIGRSPMLPFSAGTCRYLSLDICDFDKLRRTLIAEEPTTVYHLAAYSVLTAAQGEGTRAMLETNVVGTLNVLEACRRAEVPTVIVASSDKQYGALAAPPYDDEDGTAFLNGGVYELSKAQQDQTTRLYAGLYDVPAIRVARLCNIYGPGDIQWTRIVPGTIRRTIRGERPRITAGPAGESLREYLFVEDAITALRSLATDAATRGNAPLRRNDGKLARVAYNIPSGHRFPAAEVIKAVQTVMREDFGITGPEPEVFPGPSGIFEPGHQFVSPNKFRSLVPDWSPRDMPTGLRATIPWYLESLRK